MHIWNDITVIFACIWMYFDAIYDQRYNQIWLDMKLIFACICLYLTVFSSVYACINSAVCFNAPQLRDSLRQSRTAGGRRGGRGGARWPAIGYAIGYCGHSGVIVVCSSVCCIGCARRAQRRCCLGCLSACKQTKQLIRGRIIIAESTAKPLQHSNGLEHQATTNIWNREQSYVLGTYRYVPSCTHL